jgi:L-amino acid N-acyltransferase YncA
MSGSAITTGVMIRAMTPSDADAVLRIYQQGIDTGEATFETRAPSWQEFDARRLPGHRLVAVDARDAVVGWVAVTPYSSRPVYAGVVEHGVYIDPEARGQGIGLALMRALIDST